MRTLEGKTVTADPLHCQKETARTIGEKGGEYFLQIKGNQPNLLEYAQKRAGGTPLSRRASGTGGSNNGP